MKDQGRYRWCVCTPRRPCLLHFQRMSAREQAQVNNQLGIRRPKLDNERTQRSDRKGTT